MNLASHLVSGRTEAEPSPPARFGVADLQVHTAHGDGMADAETLLHHVEHATDLDVIAITDHDDVRGALLAREAHARGAYHFALVPGIEITTRAGHLLALWIDRPIRSLRPLEETIAAIHAAGGVAVLPHPFSPWTRSVGQRTLERILRIEDRGAHPDGIEVANLSLAGRATGRKARRLNAGYGLAETGGSDAHFPEAVGSAVTLFEGTLFEGTGEAALRAALERRETVGLERRHPPLREIGLRRLAEQQVRGLSVTPRKLLGGSIERARARLSRRGAEVTR